MPPGKAGRCSTIVNVSSLAASLVISMSSTASAAGCWSHETAIKNAKATGTMAAGFHQLVFVLFDLIMAILFSVKDLLKWLAIE